MKTVFTKTLIATAALALVGTANAATIRNLPAQLDGAANTAVASSLEGLLRAKTVTVGDTTLVAPAVAADVALYIKPNVTNVAQDVLVVTVAGAKFDTTTTPALVGIGGAYAGSGYDFFDFQGEDTIRFRVKSGGVTADTNIANYFRLDGVTLKVDSVANGSKVVVSSKVLSLNSVIGEYDKGTYDFLKVAKQLTVDVATAFDATISTANGRKVFVANTKVTGAPVAPDTTPAGTDQAQLTITDNAGFKALTIAAATTAKVTHVLSGDFAFVRDADKKDFNGDGNGVLSSAEILTVIKPSATDDTFTASISSDNKVTLTQTAVAGLDSTVTIKVTPPAATVTGKASSAVNLNATKITGSVSAATTQSNFAGVSDADLGGFDVDGSVVKVPYLVLQEGRFGTVVTVSNSGSRTGEILLDIVDEAGVSIATGLVAGSSTPGSIVNVSGKIKDALVAKGKDLKAVNKFSVTVTTNVPANDVLVYSAYTDSQNGGERAIVNNDSKVQSK